MSFKVYSLITPGLGGPPGQGALSFQKSLIKEYTLNYTSGKYTLNYNSGIYPKLQFRNIPYTILTIPI